MSEFLGSLVLSRNLEIDDSNQDYQFVYASQNYGTLYGIYAKFEISNGSMRSLELVIKNYRGTPRIGFMDNITTYQNPKDISLRENNELNIVLPVIAFNSNKRANINLNPPIEINSFELINFHRMLYPIDEELTESKIVFDSERFFIDDEDKLREREERPGIYHSTHDSENRIAGRNCHTSTMKVNIL